MDKRNLYTTAMHTRTGAFCALMWYDAEADRYFCNFKAHTNPFTWVVAAALSRFTL